MRNVIAIILASIFFSLSTFADADVSAIEITNIEVKKNSSLLTIRLCAAGVWYSYDAVFADVVDVSFLKSLQAQLLYAKANDRGIHIYANGTVLNGIDVR